MITSFVLALVLCVVLEGIDDAPLGGLVLAYDALGVDAQQDLHTVTGPGGYLVSGAKTRS